MAEAYDNKDVIQQILIMKDIVRNGTYSDISITKGTGDDTGKIIFDFTLTSGEHQIFKLTNEYAADILDLQSRMTAAEGDISDAEGDITSLDGRLTTAEGDITSLDGRLTNAESDIDAIEGRETDYLKKTGAAQSVTSQISVPTTATGGSDTQIANGARIQNDLAAYAPMLRTTGNQTKSGELNLTQMLGLKSSTIDETDPPAGYTEYPNIQFNDKNGNRAATLFKARNNDMNLLRIGNVYTHNGNRQRTYLVCQVDEATGLIIWFIEWGDGTSTELARKQLS